jgi:hypothetical protein
MATTDIVFGRGSILHLTKQLDSFRKKDLFLGRFRMLGRTERRRGGAESWPFTIHADAHEHVQNFNWQTSRLTLLLSAYIVKSQFWWCAGQAVVQFAHGVRDNRAYAVKFFLDEDSFYAEAAMYVAAFPNLKMWLSQRATEALEQITALPEGDANEAAQTMQAAGARFLPQVRSSLRAYPAWYWWGFAS